MAASFPSSLRGFGALLALLVAGAALSGCASMSETVAPAFADPARYELYDCKQLEGERKALAKRTDDLRGLMEKAETGAGGAIVSEPRLSQRLHRGARAVPIGRGRLAPQQMPGIAARGDTACAVAFGRRQARIEIRQSGPLRSRARGELHQGRQP